jgi:hypothetical protein
MLDPVTHDLAYKYMPTPIDRAVLICHQVGHIRKPIPSGSKTWFCLRCESAIWLDPDSLALYESTGSMVAMCRQCLSNLVSEIEEEYGPLDTTDLLYVTNPHKAMIMYEYKKRTFPIAIIPRPGRICCLVYGRRTHMDMMFPINS